MGWCVALALGELNAFLWMYLLIRLINPGLLNINLFSSITIDSLKASLPKQVQESIKSVMISDSSHFSFWEAGHCASNSRGSRIHINKRYAKISPWVIWHEAAHAYHFFLDRTGSDFSERWQGISGAVLTRYGKTNHEEDIAVCVEEFYLSVYGHYSAFSVFLVETPFCGFRAVSSKTHPPFAAWIC